MHAVHPCVDLNLLVKMRACMLLPHVLTPPSQANDALTNNNTTYILVDHLRSAELLGILAIGL
jgi:hypothetical protein